MSGAHRGQERGGRGHGGDGRGGNGERGRAGHGARGRGDRGGRPGAGDARRRDDDRRPARPRRPDPARHAALDVLREVAEQDAYANLILGDVLAHHRLTGRDAAFATELAYGALRLQGRHDAVIDRCLTGRTTADLDADVLDVLRLGVHQLLAMRVPDHAAVSATVDLAAATVGQGPAKFVNAVLRAVARRDESQWLAELTAGLPAGAEGDDERLAIEFAHPAWVVRAYREALAADGRPAADLPALLAANNAPPRVTLVARPGLVGRARLAEQVEGATGRVREPGVLSPYALTLPGGPPSDVTAVRSGKAAVQDEGSQAVALALAAAELADADRGAWADLCAGPGGKAALLGALAARTGARVFANESASHRADLVRRSVRALPDGAVEVHTGDGRTSGVEHAGEFDRVLVDVPCTGLGALRRRPESRWRRTEADLADLVVLQRDLLAAAVTAVRPGGVVAYATCSPHVAETRDIVAAVLADPPGGVVLEVLDARAAAAANIGAYIGAGADGADDDAHNGPSGGVDPTAIDLGGGPYLQLWPHVHGTDAMFLALLRRRS